MKKDKYNFFTAVRKLFKYASNNKKQYILGTVFMIFFVITAMIYTTMYSKLIANIMSLNLDKAIRLVLICGVLRIFSITLCHNQYRRIVISTGEKISASIQKNIYSRVVNLSMISFEDIKSGKIFTTIKAADSGMMSTISSLLQESAYVLTSVVMLFIIFFIDWKIGLGVTIISGLSLFLFKMQLDKSKQYLQDEFEYSDNYSTLINETVKGFKEIKALDLKKECYNIFKQDIDNLKDTRTTRRLLGKNVNTAKWTIRIIGDALIILYIISKVQTGEFSVETAMLIITYMTNVIDDVFHRIIEHDFGISEFTANMKRITYILEGKNLNEEKFGNNNYQNIEGNIKFSNVNFKYNKSKNQILEDINFEFKPHTKNAIVGQSGAGKTTIFKLLLKEYDDYNGEILFDNKNIKDFSEESFRNTISIVNQEPILFNMSIKKNLLMAKENATDEEIINACKLANIDEFIENLPNKYDEIINENNNNISVGQKQRIAIARVILRNTPIILFDEATSALDNYSKRKIEETIDELSKTKTIVLIAHSLEMLENFDNIIMLEDGRIIEKGSNEELINNKGSYYQLLNV